MRTATLTFLFLMGSSLPALAAATPEEAQRLTGLFQSYLGAEPGVVTVTPNGDSYAARFNLAPHFAKIKEPGVSVSLTPIEWMLTDQGGGKWKVDQDQPLSFAFKVEGKVDMKGSFGGIKGTGIFDEALGAFASTATEFTQFAFDQTVVEAGQTTRVTYTIGKISAQSTMSGSGDNADGTANYTFTDLAETISMPGQADGSMPPMDFSITAPSGSQQAMVKGLKPKAVNELVAWIVARPAKETIIAEQADLKNKLRAALPLFGNVSGTATINDLSVNSMMGKFGVQKLDVLVDMNGIVEKGFFEEKVTFTGLKLPEGIVPPWAADLVPQNLTVDFTVADFNLAAPANIMLDKLDLSKDPPLPPEIEAELQKALLPSGSVTLGLGPSEVIARIFDLKAEGSMTAGPMSMPAGQALLKLKGIDEIMAAVQNSPPEMGLAQMAPMIIMAKGMGKQEADGYITWKIESTANGGVTVNGVDPMKMGGQ